MKVPIIPQRIPIDGRGYGRQERERGRDRDRRAEQPWRAWYRLPIWADPTTGLRAMQLSREPICETCRRAAATIAHHKLPHGGVWELFIDPSNLESACKTCHDGAIQRGERSGNYGRTIERSDGVAIPANVLYPRLRPSAVPLTIVAGPPASGKTTFVNEHKRAEDLVIDVDHILAELAGSLLRTAEVKRRYLHAALIERNRRLARLADDDSASASWFIVGAAPGREREAWASRLGARRVILIETPLQICVARIRQDTTRSPDAGELAVRDWFARFTPSNIDQGMATCQGDRGLAR